MTAWRMPTVGVDAGHNARAKTRLDHLLDLHRQGGPVHVREFLRGEEHRSLAPAERDDLLVEAVLTLAERGYPRRGRRAIEEFQREEQRQDDRWESKGGNA